MPYPPRHFHWLIFALLFLLAAYLRCFAFFLPSNVGDPPSYQALAMKMNYGFMKHYNVLNYRVAVGEIPGTVDYVWENDPRKWNAMRTRASNRRPLNMQPPFLPVSVWLFHGIFKHGGPYTSVAKNLGAQVMRHPPWEFLRAQGYAIAVPFLLSLLTLVAVYLFCLRFFSWKEGLLALLFLVPSPVDIAVAPKLYTDGVVTALSFLALMTFLISLEKPGRTKFGWAALAGLLLGLTFLAKLQGILFAVAMIAAVLLHPRWTAPWWDRLLDPRLILAGILCFLVALPWNLLVYQFYGTFVPNTPQDPGNAWFRYVFGRPPQAYFLGTLYFLPACILGWIYGLRTWFEPRRLYPESVLALMAVFFTGMMIVFMKTGTAGLEHRYLLPIYPLLAILSARAIIRIWGRIHYPKIRVAFTGLTILGLVLLGWRSAEIGVRHLLSGVVTFAPWGM